MKLSVFVFVFLALCIGLQAQPKRIKVKKEIPKKKYEFSIAYESKSGASYFDMNSGISSYVLDTIPAKIKIDSIKTKDTVFNTKHIFDLKQHSFIPEFKMNVSDDLFIIAQARLTYSKFMTTYGLDSASYWAGLESLDKNESMFNLEYFKLGTEYTALSGPLTIIALGDILIPGGFHNGLYSDSSYKFLSDGAFQANIGVKLLSVGETYRAGIFGGYNFRGEEFKNRYFLGAETVLSSVQGTEFSLAVTYYKSIGAWDKPMLFDVSRTTAQDDLLTFRVGFNVFLDDNIFTRFDYELVGWGKNTWLYGLAKLKLGYTFD